MSDKLYDVKDGQSVLRNPTIREVDSVSLFGVIVQAGTDPESGKSRLTIETTEQQLRDLSISPYGKQCRIEVLENISAQIMPNHGLSASGYSADMELMKARNIGDALAAALLGEYSRADALGMWAADLKLPDNQELVDRLKSDGIPISKWQHINNKVYSPNAPRELPEREQP